MPNQDQPATSDVNETSVPEDSDYTIEPAQIVYDRETGEFLLVADSGDNMVLRAFGEAPPDDEDGEPRVISAEDFGKALSKLKELGLTWTADSPPIVIPIDKESEANFASEEFFQLQDDFPNLPREVAILVSYTLTGSMALIGALGDENELKAKADLVTQYILTPAYRSEFFYKHAIKVPYLDDIDWEIVLKLHEKGVQHVPALTYGILSLVLKEPRSPNKASELNTVTVAVNEESVERLLYTLQDVKANLERSRKVTESVPLWNGPKQEASNDKDSGTNPVE